MKLDVVGVIVCCECANCLTKEFTSELEESGRVWTICPPPTVVKVALKSLFPPILLILESTDVAFSLTTIMSSAALGLDARSNT